MKHVMPALRMLIFMTILTGIIYPVAVTILSQLLFAKQANGSLIQHGDQAVGSSLIAQEFKSPKYFWPRPSAAGFSPMPTTGSNLGPTSADLKKIVGERLDKLKLDNPGAGEPPQDLLFASGSGVDPDISPMAAHYQAARVANARQLTSGEVIKLIDKWTEGRQLGVWGEPRVNVLALNLALDQLQRGEAQ